MVSGGIVYILGDGSKFDKHERPDYGYEPTTVNVSMDFGRLNYLDTAKQTFEINFFLLLSWEDDRLYFDDDLGHEDFIELEPGIISSFLLPRSLEEQWTPSLIYLDPQGKVRLTF